MPSSHDINNLSLVIMKLEDLNNECYEATLTRTIIECLDILNNLKRALIFERNKRLNMWAN